MDQTAAKDEEQQAREHVFPASLGRADKEDTFGESQQRWAMQSAARARKYEKEGKHADAAREYAFAAHNSKMAKHDYKYYNREQGGDPSSQDKHILAHNQNAARMFAKIEDHHAAATHFAAGRQYDKAAENRALFAKTLTNDHAKIKQLNHAIVERHYAVNKGQGDSEAHSKQILQHHEEIIGLHSGLLEKARASNDKNGEYEHLQNIAQQHKLRAAKLGNTEAAQKARDEAIKHTTDALKLAKQRNWWGVDHHKRELAALHHESRKYHDTQGNAEKSKEHNDQHMSHLGLWDRAGYKIKKGTSIAKNKGKGLFVARATPKQHIPKIPRTIQPQRRLPK